VTYLLDTATWANLVVMPEVLPERIRQLLKAPQQKGLCAISLLECAIHFRRGRLKFKGDLPQFFEAGLAADIAVIDLTPDIAAATNDLPQDFPGDPFDRTIAATARVLKLTLITPDAIIRDAQFCPIEYYPFRPSRRLS